MSSPDITDFEKHAVENVLQTPFLSFGPQIKKFENRFSNYCSSSFAIGVSSGTAGLHLAVIAANVDKNDLVITSPFSFVASANCILYERGIPIFVDVDENTGNINPDKVYQTVESFNLNASNKKQEFLLERKIRNYQGSPDKLKAILPVHAFGQPADLDPIIQIAQENNLFVIEDACEALGAEYKGKKAGALGDVGIFAFYPNKQITTGEGGMIVTNNKNWNTLFRSLRNQGRDEFNSWLNHDRLGYNYRLDELSAALGVVQMNRIEEILTKRTRVANWYNERLKDQELLEIPFIHPNTTKMSWFVYVIKILPPADRNSVMKKLESYDIPSRPYFSPIHLQPYYRKMFGYQEGDFPIAERLGSISLALPFSGIMKENEVDFVCAKLKTVLSKE